MIGPFGADEIELALAIHPCSEVVKSHVAAVKISKSESEAADTCAAETGEQAATSKNGGAEQQQLWKQLYKKRKKWQKQSR